MRLIRSFLRDQSGATAIEYGLIAALVGVAVIGGVTALGSGITNIFGIVENEIVKAGK